MTRQQLARELRECQFEYGAVPGNVLYLLTDDQIIESYVTCSCCGERLVSDADLAAAIKNADDSEDFLEMCEEFSGD
jgi:hypothetical protein